MGPFFLAADQRLEDPPHKMGQQCEQEQHEYAAHPDEKIPGHFGIVNLFFCPWLKLACGAAENIGSAR